MRPCDQRGRCRAKAQHRLLFCLPTLRNVPGPPHMERKAQSCKAAEGFVTVKIPRVIEIPLPGLRQRRTIPSRSFLLRTAKMPLYAGPSLNRRRESGTSFARLLDEKAFYPLAIELQAVDLGPLFFHALQRSAPARSFLLCP